MSFSEHRYRSRDKLSLYYRSYGSSDRVVVCLPGLTRNCKDFEDLAGHLAGHVAGLWRVLTPDLRGSGERRKTELHPGIPWPPGRVLGRPRPPMLERK